MKYWAVLVWWWKAMGRRWAMWLWTKCLDKQENPRELPYNEQLVVWALEDAGVCWGVYTTLQKAVAAQHLCEGMDFAIPTPYVLDATKDIEGVCFILNKQKEVIDELQANPA